MLLSIICLIISLNSQAQTKSEKVNLIWGDEQVLNKKTAFDDIIGTDVDGVYIIKRTRKGKAPIIIEKYSNDMSLKKSVPIILRPSPPKAVKLLDGIPRVFRMQARNTTNLFVRVCNVTHEYVLFVGREVIGNEHQVGRLVARLVSGRFPSSQHFEHA